MLSDGDVPHRVARLDLIRPLQIRNFHPRWFLFEVGQHALVLRPLWQKDELTLVRDCDLSHRAVGAMRVISQVLSGRRAVLAFAHHIPLVFRRVPSWHRAQTTQPGPLPGFLMPRPLRLRLYSRTNDTEACSAFGRVSRSVCVLTALPPQFVQDNVRKSRCVFKLSFLAGDIYRIFLLVRLVVPLAETAAVRYVALGGRASLPPLENRYLGRHDCLCPSTSKRCSAQYARNKQF